VRPAACWPWLLLLPVFNLEPEGLQLAGMEEEESTPWALRLGTYLHEKKPVPWKRNEASSGEQTPWAVRLGTYLSDRSARAADESAEPALPLATRLGNYLIGDLAGEPSSSAASPAQASLAVEAADRGSAGQGEPKEEVVVVVSGAKSATPAEQVAEHMAAEKAAAEKSSAGASTEEEAEAEPARKGVVYSKDHLAQLAALTKARREAEAAAAASAEPEDLT
jgi:hypothetical protein